jgi:hypothetical protein
MNKFEDDILGGLCITVYGAFILGSLWIIYSLVKDNLVTVLYVAGAFIGIPLALFIVGFVARKVLEKLY